MKIIVLVSGGFDPIHSGHIQYFKKASALGNELIVGVNSDEWLQRKKGKSFLAINERVEIIKNFRMVNEVVTWDDSDGSAIKLIETLLLKCPNHRIIFANGGDRTANNIPEIKKFENHKNVLFKFGVGGKKKINSSRKILKEWNRK